MPDFATLALDDAPSVTAPDGMTVRPLLALAGGGFATFHLPAGQTGRAVVHRTVEEIWFVLEGRGEMARLQDGRTAITPLEPGVCITIPVGTIFQVRAAAGEPLAAVAVTMPPWPGEGEALAAKGPWPPTV